jgi:hypothetical protein
LRYLAVLSRDEVDTRRCCLLIVLVQYAHHGGRRGMLAFLLARGDDEPGGYCAATLPRPVRHGDPAGAAQDDIGQSLASTRRKSSSLIRRLFMGCCNCSSRMQQPMKDGRPCCRPDGRTVSQVLTCETATCLASASQ